MGIFSMLFGSKQQEHKTVVVDEDVSHYLDNNFFKYIVEPLANSNSHR